MAVTVERQTVWFSFHRERRAAGECRRGVGDDLVGDPEHAREAVEGPEVGVADGGATGKGSPSLTEDAPRPRVLRQGP